MNTNNRLPDEVIGLMDQFIRDITKHNCAVMGMVYRTEPEVGMGMMRNMTGNPVTLWHKLGQIVEDSQRGDRIVDVPVLPLS